MSPARDQTRSISTELAGMQCITLASLDNMGKDLADRFQKLSKSI